MHVICRVVTWYVMLSRDMSCLHVIRHVVTWYFMSSWPLRDFFLWFWKTSLEAKFRVKVFVFQIWRFPAAKAWNSFRQMASFISWWKRRRTGTCWDMCKDTALYLNLRSRITSGSCARLLVIATPTTSATGKIFQTDVESAQRRSDMMTQCNGKFISLFVWWEATRFPLETCHLRHFPTLCSLLTLNRNK